MKRGPQAQVRPAQSLEARPELESLEDRWMPAAVRYLPGFFDNALERVNDDNSVQAKVGFALNFFGVNTNKVFINENGNLTFNDANPTFTTPKSLTDATGNPIIAPFFADVDTSSPASGIITYGTDKIAGFKAFAVTWYTVTMFSENPQLTLFNTFQVVLIQRADTGRGNFDIEFNYNQIQWDTGDKNNPLPLPPSGETDANGNPIVYGSGTGGQSVRVGYSSGTGNPAQYYELGGSGVYSTMTDNGLLA